MGNKNLMDDFGRNGSHDISPIPEAKNRYPHEAINNLAHLEHNVPQKEKFAYDRLEDLYSPKIQSPKNIQRYQIGYVHEEPLVKQVVKNNNPLMGGLRGIRKV